MATVDLSKPVGDQINPDAAKPKKPGKTVTMVFPRQIHVRETHHTRHTFKAGVNEVPEHLVNHPYLKVQGVVPYVVPKAAVKPVVVEEEPEVEETGNGVEGEEQEPADTEPTAAAVVETEDVATVVKTVAANSTAAKKKTKK